MRLLFRYRDVLLIALAAALTTLLAQSALVSGIPAFLIGALGPALLPVLLLQRRRGQRRRTYTFFQRLIDGLPDAFYVKDANSRYLMVNQAFTRERGTAPEDIVGKTSEEVLGADAPGSIAEDRVALQGELISKEQAVRHPLPRAGSASTRWSSGAQYTSMAPRSWSARTSTSHAGRWPSASWSASPTGTR